MVLELGPALAVLRREFPELVGTYLFGSAADGTDKDGSDVDLAIFAGRALDRARVFEVQEAIAKTLRRDVDLVDLAAASTILQIQAIGEGRLVDVADPDAIALFELRVMRDYMDLKARRSAAEAEIARSGRVLHA